MIWLWMLLSCQFIWLQPGQGGYHRLSAAWFSADLKNPDSLFGFSITYEPTSKRLIVGAPKADSIGGIYSCDIDSHNACTSLPKDTKRYNTMYNHTYWLGAVVKAGPSYFVTCAPFNVNGRNHLIGKVPKFLIGTFSRCYNYSKLTEFTTLRILSEKDREKDARLFEQKMDSFGWSIDVVENDIMIGGPAMYTGRAIKYYNVEKDPVSLTGNNSNENNRVDYNFGYSVAIGYFESSLKKIIRYAVGSPYGRNGYGTVSFYTSFKKTDMYLSGVLIGSDESTVGSMFGAVLCAAKLSSSTRDALLVGAPTYATKHAYNLGAVYIYEPGKLPLNKLIRKIVGGQNGGFFGSSIVSVGDLNGDGRDEIAIGAPYEDSGVGAVYLYSSAEIISKKTYIGHIQRITPERTGIKQSFGFSLTAIQDHDENGCKELGIGAPEDNMVMVLRCIASVTVKLDEYIPADLRLRSSHHTDSSGRRPVEARDDYATTFHSMSELKKALSSPGNKYLNRNNTHFKFISCLEMVYPDKPKDIQAHLKMHVQITHPDAKLAKDEDMEYIISLKRDQTLICKDIIVEIPENGNYGFPIMYKITAEQIENPLYIKEFNPQKVSLSDLSTLSSSNLIWIAECDTNNCMPKLQHIDTLLSTSAPLKDDTYVIGSTKTIEVDTTVNNMGEVAYDPCIQMSFNRFSSVRASIEPISVTIVSPDCERHGSKLKCAPKQILRTNDTWNTQSISLDVTDLTNEHDLVMIRIDMYNHCNENKFETITKNITLIPSSEGIFIRGITDTGLDSYVNMTQNDVTLGKAFEHSYTISNSGPTNWVGVAAKLVIQKRSFIKSYPIILSAEDVSSLESQTCELEDKNALEIAYRCQIETLFKNAGIIKITVPFFVLPDSLEKAIDEKVNTVNTVLTLNFDGTTWSANVNSVINLNRAIVPLWIILVASFMGLLILLTFCLILRECGFFRREKKESLKRVQKNVKRQTIMRRSMIEGLRIPPGADGQALIQPQVEEETDRRFKSEQDTNATS